MNAFTQRSSLLFLGAALTVIGHHAMAEGDDPVVQSSKQSHAFAALPVKQLEQRVRVAIYEFP